MFKRLAGKSIEMTITANSIRYIVHANTRETVQIDQTEGNKWDVWIEENGHVTVQPFPHDGGLFGCLKAADEILQEIAIERINAGDNSYHTLD